MSDPKFLNARHQQRSEEAKRLRLAFCAAYAYLLRARIKAGQDKRGIQVLAAKAAGVGQQRVGSAGSWSDHAAYQTQRSVSTRLLKEDLVKQELVRLGLVYDEQKGNWHDPKIQRTR